MRQHALRTAMTLYQDGTLDLEAAAARAGVSPEALERAVARLGRPVQACETDSEATLERASVRAD